MHTVGQIGKVISSRGGAAAAPMATQYDGTNDGAYWPSLPTGLADGPAFTMSLHFKATKSGAGDQYFTDQGIAFFHRMGGTGTGILRWLDTAVGSPALNLAMGSNLDDGNIHSLVVAGDRISGRRQVYVDRAAILNDTGYATANDLDFTTEFYVFIKNNATEAFGGFAWEFWWDDTAVNIATELNKFVNPDNTAADKGATGTIPTGSAPRIYAPDGNPVVNLGSGGNATAIGSPSTVARPTS